MQDDGGAENRVRERDLPSTSVFGNARHDGGFSATLVAFRAARNLTQEYLAELSGLSVRAIRNLELGRTDRPQRHSVHKLAVAMDLTGEDTDTLLLAAGHPPLAGVSRGRSQQLTPCELPAGPAAFFGREQVMAAISRELTRRARAGRPRLAVVSGPPGIGKTATVVQIADRLRQDFPDGQIYTDLDQPNEPAMPASALLGRLLRSLGLTGLPDGVDERSALLRSVLAARRVLVVLDNVHSESQVRPLLGTSSGSALLVAGCERLPALSFGTTAELAALDETAAKSLLGGLIGNARITAESAAGKAIIDYCERNPLALSIAGMVLAARPRRGLADFARLMADKDNRLDRLVAGDLSVRASVEARCRRLAADEMHALRQIGSHTLGWFEPGDIGNIPAGIVDRLIRGHFLEESAAARCRVEPLVRLYLAELDTRSRSVHAISLMNTVTAHSA